MRSTETFYWDIRRKNMKKSAQQTYLEVLNLCNIAIDYSLMCLQNQFFQINRTNYILTLEKGK